MKCIVISQKLLIHLFNNLPMFTMEKRFQYHKQKMKDRLKDLDMCTSILLFMCFFQLMLPLLGVYKLAIFFSYLLFKILCMTTFKLYGIKFDNMSLFVYSYIYMKHTYTYYLSLFILSQAINDCIFLSYLKTFFLSNFLLNICCLVSNFYKFFQFYFYCKEAKR